MFDACTVHKLATMCDWLGAYCPSMQVSRVFGVKTRAATD